MTATANILSKRVSLGKYSAFVPAPLPSGAGLDDACLHYGTACD
jgi:hypothetical protein